MSCMVFILILESALFISLRTAEQKNKRGGKCMGEVKKVRILCADLEERTCEASLNGRN